MLVTALALVLDALAVQIVLEEFVEFMAAFVLAYAFVIELSSLGGRERLLPTPCVSIIHYD